MHSNSPSCIKRWFGKGFTGIPGSWHRKLRFSLAAWCGISSVYLINKNQRQDSRSFGHVLVHFHAGCQETACSVILMHLQDAVRGPALLILLGLAGSAVPSGVLLPTMRLRLRLDFVYILFDFISFHQLADLNNISYSHCLQSPVRSWKQYWPPMVESQPPRREIYWNWTDRGNASCEANFQELFLSQALIWEGSLGQTSTEAEMEVPECSWMHSSCRDSSRLLWYFRSK